MIQLQKASIEDISVIYKLAEQIWKLHYPPIIGMPQVEYMLANMYNSETLKKQMLEEQHQFYLVKNKTENIGFITVSKKAEEVFLHKFYILQQEQNKGLGSIVFELIQQEINPFSIIRLTVNRQNFTAINFYFKNGFVIEKVADFDIGNGYQMNDFIMKWEKKN